LKFLIISSNNILEEFVLKSLKASPLTKPLLTPVGGWHEEKCVYWNVSVGLKCVRTSSTAAFFDLSPLYTLVSKNVVSVSGNSAVNLIVGWCLFACSMNLLISFLTFQSEKMSSVKRNERFYHALAKNVCFNFNFAMKMLAKATAILIPMAVPCVCK